MESKSKSLTEERRLERRFRIPSTQTSWTLRITPPDGPEVILDLIDTSKSGFCARLRANQTWTHLESMRGSVPGHLEGHSESPLPLLFEMVEIRHNAETNEALVHSHVKDDESKAILWNIVHQIRFHGAPSTEAPIAPDTFNLAPKIPERGLYTEQARQTRLHFIEEISGHTLETIRKSQLKANRLAGNIENHIGGVEIPLGLAGPLLFKGKNVSGPIYAPFATSEGALVASASRGSLLLSESGGVTTRIISQRMIRVPMFVMDSLDSALFFSDWLMNHVPELQEAVSKVSRHATLLSVDITLTGRVIHASFVYSTGDAAGQNMTTAATWHACQWALSQAKLFRGVFVENFLIDSGMSGDKKVNFKSFIEGRGTKVVAEAFIPEETLMRIMKVSSQDLVNYYNSGLAALIQAGIIGSNINVANTIAAIFTATGQDIACVHESSLANLFLEAVDGGVYATMKLPSLIVGTVGGGAGLPMQAECLKMIDCFGANKAPRLAEIIAGFCLALDLSTMSALVNGTFVKAHERLGRNRPVQWLAPKEIDANFLTSVLRSGLKNERLKVIGAAQTETLNTEDSIITELTARNQDKFLGLYPYTLTYEETAGGPPQEAHVILKSKPTDLEVIMLANKMAAMCSSALGDLYDRFKTRNEANSCHHRELQIYSMGHPLFAKNTPQYYGSYQDDRREAYLLIIGHIKNARLIGKPDQPHLWTKSDTQAAIRGMAELYSIWYKKDHELRQQPWIGVIPNAASKAEQKTMMREMIRHAALESPFLVTPEILTRNYELIDSIETWWTELEGMGQTLIHNDFNPRNIAIVGSAEAPQLCAFDWELATIQVPQHDLAEFLTFVTTDKTSAEEIDAYIELHRTTLTQLVDEEIDPRLWRRGYELSLYDLAVNRIAMYLMAHTFKHYNFMEHIVRNHNRLIDLEQERVRS